MTFVNDEQPMNAFDPIDVTPPHVIVESDVHPWNALFPIDIVVLGNDNVLNPVHPWKALLPIVWTELIVNELKALHPLNA